MSKTGWKRVERTAAALLGGTRFAANTGGRLDTETDAWVSQIKNTARLSLAQLEALAVEMERVAFQRGKLGCVIVKRSAGRGKTTPHLVVVTEGVWRELTGRMPSEAG